MSTIPAIIYKRHSTDHQDGQRQDFNIANYCPANNLRVEHELADPGECSDTPMLKRPSGKKIFALIEEYTERKQAFAVVVMEQDRIGRDVIDQLTTIRAIVDAGGTIHFTDEGGAVDWAKSEFMINVKAVMAQETLKQIRRKTKSKHDQLVGAGKLAGHIPFGYDAIYLFADGHKERVTTKALRFGNAQKGIEAEPGAAELMETHGRVVDKVLVDNESEQQWVRWMAERISKDSWSMSAVARGLTSRGVLGKQGNPLQVGNVESILNNNYTKRILAEEKSAIAA